MKEEIKQRLAALRGAMVDKGIYATILPQTDPHQSEYLAPHWQVRRYLSGFTGSAGDLVVTPDKALLWTDSRYFLQAEEQLEGTGIILMKDGLPETPSIISFLCETVPSATTVGIDGMLFTNSQVMEMRGRLGMFNIKLVTDFDPIDAIWPDRPALPKDKVFIHDIKYAGRSVSDKIADLLAAAEKSNAQDILISALDEIAWTLNLRSTDVNCNPVATAFLLLSPLGSTLFIDPDKLTPEVIDHLDQANVKTAAYDDLIPTLEGLSARKILADSTRTGERIFKALAGNFVNLPTPVAMAKGCKNEVQIEGTRHAMERDGVALVKSFMEIERRLAAGEPTTEIDVDTILHHFRSAQDLFFDLSFETIAGYGPHGAIVHYSATEQSSSTLRPEGLLLVDSGAQYLDGTTDITRTIALGTPTAQEKSDFTLVMKGHIALGTAIFPEGTRGAQLDVLARQFLWQHGLSYLHGTGHGVGHFLNVHEGPQSIRLNENPTPLTPGMITSNEPGLYRAGIHGIRCENLVLTVPAFTTEFGRFLKFETLTLFPFDRNLFDLHLMTEQEINWVDQYHTTVYNRLSPHLSASEQAWLRAKTLPLRD
ncbi:MAG: aminopeptidase P family protein [Muribaculaceae bacterium]|nr:aminopeptidase P family protein [Muribaculaceae bacterium]